MAGTRETERALLAQHLRRDRCACLVLAEVLEMIAEEPAADEALQMDRLYGTARLLDLVGQSVGQVYSSLVK